MKIFQNKVILVADDDPANREFVVTTMSSMAQDVKVLSAADGQQVLDILGKRSVDAVLLDWEMPVLDGLQTLKKIRANEDWKHIPVLMYTGVMTATTNLVKALDAGASDFIRKPAEPVEVIARIKSALQLKDEFSTRLRLEQENAQMSKRLLEEKIERLRNELSSYLAQLARKNEVLIEVREMLRKNPADSPVVTHIDGIINSENYWDDLFQRFGHLDNGFLSTLNRQFEELSTTELKFCLLVRIGMNSKDIASLLNVTLAAVEKKRYRIRKKFDLDPEESLEKYILSL